MFRHVSPSLCLDLNIRTLRTKTSDPSVGSSEECHNTPLLGDYSKPLRQVSSKDARSRVTAPLQVVGPAVHFTAPYR